MLVSTFKSLLEFPADDSREEVREDAIELLSSTVGVNRSRDVGVEALLLLLISVAKRTHESPRFRFPPDVETDRDIDDGVTAPSTAALGMRLRFKCSCKPSGERFEFTGTTAFSYCLLIDVPFINSALARLCNSSCNAGGVIPRSKLDSKILCFDMAVVWSMSRPNAENVVMIWNNSVYTIMNRPQLKIPEFINLKKNKVSQIRKQYMLPTMNCCGNSRTYWPMLLLRMQCAFVSEIAPTIDHAVNVVIRERRVSIVEPKIAKPIQKLSERSSDESEWRTCVVMGDELNITFSSAPKRRERKIMLDE
mmetsp:Transcript_10848/g.16679  ORF Transcript_10848/g.16679 Transcript_10848/m.16679 type:complete len:307 (-) Transcript_10848:369-1289(-)